MDIVKWRSDWENVLSHKISWALCVCVPSQYEWEIDGKEQTPKPITRTFDSILRWVVSPSPISPSVWFIKFVGTKNPEKSIPYNHTHSVCVWCGNWLPTKLQFFSFYPGPVNVLSTSRFVCSVMIAFSVQMVHLTWEPTCQSYSTKVARFTVVESDAILTKPSTGSLCHVFWVCWMCVNAEQWTCRMCVCVTNIDWKMISCLHVYNIFLLILRRLMYSEHRSDTSEMGCATVQFGAYIRETVKQQFVCKFFRYYFDDEPFPSILRPTNNISMQLNMAHDSFMHPT